MKGFSWTIVFIILLSLAQSFYWKQRYPDQPLASQDYLFIVLLSIIVVMGARLLIKYFKSRKK